MKKSDLKKILKPIVKECILESLAERGVLSTIISEVLQGVQVQPKALPQKQSIVTEQQSAPKQSKFKEF